MVNTTVTNVMSLRKLELPEIERQKFLTGDSRGFASHHCRDDSYRSNGKSSMIPIDPLWNTSDFLRLLILLVFFPFSNPPFWCQGWAPRPPLIHITGFFQGGFRFNIYPLQSRPPPSFKVFPNISPGLHLFGDDFARIRVPEPRRQFRKALENISAVRLWEFLNYDLVVNNSVNTRKTQP